MKKINIIPLADRVIVKQDAAETTTASGIIIPDTAQEKPQKGIVVAVGKGKALENGTMYTPDLKTGDKILFSKYAGSEVKIGGSEHLVMREDDILGVFVN